MKTFKDTQNKLHVIEDEFKHLLPDGCIEVTEVEAEAIRLAQVVPPTYQQLRSAEYPPAADYLDAIVKGDAVQKQAYIDACLAVKAKYPKP